ncbi:MAG: fibronectin type III domain-containing protein [Leifsonia sp.]
MNSPAESSLSRRAPAGRLGARRLLVLVAAAVAALFVTMGGTGGTYALWSDSAVQQPAAVGAGSIVAVSALTPAPTVTYSAGTLTRTGALTITNSGTSDATFTTTTSVTGSTALASATDVAIWSSTAVAGCATPLAPVTGTWSTMPQLTGSLAAGASRFYCVRTTLQSPLNLTSGSAVSATFATQLKLSSWTSSASSTVAQSFVDAVPSTPTGLVASGTTATATTLSWTAATDDVAVTGYDIYRNGVLAGSVTGTSFTQTGLSPSTTYTFTVVARDGAGHASAASTARSVTTSAAADTTAPSTPTLTNSQVSPTAVRLNWTAATDNVGVTSYLVYRGSTVVATVAAPALTFTDTDRTPGTAYSYTVRARDLAGNVSAASNVSTITLPPLLTCVGRTWEVVYTWTNPANGDPDTKSYNLYLNGQLTANNSGPYYREIRLSPAAIHAVDVGGSVFVVVKQVRQNGQEVTIGTGIALTTFTQYGDPTVACG